MADFCRGFHCAVGSVSRLLKNYCGTRLRRCAVLGILTYVQVRSGSCALCAWQPGILATFFNSLLGVRTNQNKIFVFLIPEFEVSDAKFGVSMPGIKSDGAVVFWNLQ